MIIEEPFKQEPIMVETRYMSQVKEPPKKIRFNSAVFFEETKLGSMNGSTTSNSPMSKLKRSMTLAQVIEEASSTSNLCRKLNKIAESNKNLSPDQIRSLNMCSNLLNFTESLKEEIGNVALGGSSSTKQYT
jgi:hypothetical protein